MTIWNLLNSIIIKKTKVTMNKSTELNYIKWTPFISPTPFISINPLHYSSYSSSSSEETISSSSSENVINVVPVPAQPNVIGSSSENVIDSSSENVIDIASTETKSTDFNFSSSTDDESPTLLSITIKTVKNQDPETTSNILNSDVVFYGGLTLAAIAILYGLYQWFKTPPPNDWSFPSSKPFDPDGPIEYSGEWSFSDMSSWSGEELSEGTVKMCVAIIKEIQNE